MNRIDFTQQGGFPLLQDTLDFMQAAIRNTITGIARAFGDKVILWGCTKNANNVVLSGWVIVNGEILYTAGGAASTVYIGETSEAVIFANGASQGVYKNRSLKFGVGEGTPTMNWSDFKRIETVNTISSAIFPIGGIIMWSGAIEAIPAGWALCDGTQGTPNLKGRFIVGYDAESPTTPSNITYTTPNTGSYGIANRPKNYGKIGNKGGNNGVSIRDFEEPAHWHYVAVNNGVGGPDGNNLSATTTLGRNREVARDLSYRLVGLSQAADIGKSSSAGGVLGVAAEHENRPEYYVLAYIMKISN